MNIIWEINEPDIAKVKDFVERNKNPFVENRMNRNVNHDRIQINKDVILKAMLMSLLSSQQDIETDNKIELFFRKEQFLLTYQYFEKEPNIEEALHDMLKINGLTKFLKSVPGYFSLNFNYLEESNWALQSEFKIFLKNESTKYAERVLADSIDQIFKGFGSKQARDFLQILGLAKYEIPIDTGTINWMRNFGFPISFSIKALQDKAFYHFVSDGIQLLCEKANIYPCVFDAVIFSSNVGINQTK